jgi:hypothetical protein
MEFAMTRREVLLATRFGERIAEEEGSELNAYFVETDSWRRIYGGEVDVVYGVKGAGKSAIYSLQSKKLAKLACYSQFNLPPCNYQIIA